MTMLKTWNPCALLSSNGVNHNYAVIILNRPINIPLRKSRIISLWQNATVRLTVDGGTDRWLYWLEMNNISKDSIKHPDLITGDMDSIQQDTLEIYSSNRNCKIITTSDQSETDFTKALKELKNYTKEYNKQIDFVLVITEDSGRFDQIIANVNTLYKAAKFYSNVDLIVLSNASLSWLLWTGSHKIQVPTTVLEYSRWCSLIPFGSLTYVTSTGLKWNLSNTPLAFGQLVSTSNAFTDSTEISVTTDNPILWSMGINSKAIP